MSDNQSGGAPFTYVIFPLITAFVLASFALIFYLRRRRHRIDQYQAYHARRVMAPDGAVVFISRNRPNPWRVLRPNEGLNELGEAPPPYENKKMGPSAGAGATSSAGATELRDMEGGRMPPEYIAAPPPAFTVDSRRTVS